MLGTNVETHLGNALGLGAADAHGTALVLTLHLHVENLLGGILAVENLLDEVLAVENLLDEVLAVENLLDEVLAVENLLDEVLAC